MKVIALSTTIVGVLFIIISLIIRAIAYKTTKQSLDQVQPNNYLDHTEEDDFESHKIDDSKIINLKMIALLIKKIIIQKRVQSIQTRVIQI